MVGGLDGKIINFTGFFLFSARCFFVEQANLWDPKIIVGCLDLDCLVVLHTVVEGRGKIVKFDLFSFLAHCPLLEQHKSLESKKFCWVSNFERLRAL